MQLYASAIYCASAECQSRFVFLSWDYNGDRRIHGTVLHFGKNGRLLFIDPGNWPHASEVHAFFQKKGAVVVHPPQSMSGITGIVQGIIGLKIRVTVHSL